MQNPFIKDTISYELFKEMQSGSTLTFREIQNRFGSSRGLIEQILKRDHWLYNNDRKPSKKKGEKTFVLTTKFKMKPQRDIDQELFQKQIENTRILENAK